MSQSHDTLPPSALPSSDSMVVKLLEQPAEKPVAATLSRQRFFIPAVFLIYAFGDGAWQIMDDLLGNDNYKSYAGRTLLDGLAQAFGSSVMNEIVAYFKITDHWSGWEISSSFITGALWLPIVHLGEYFSRRANEPDPNSVNAILLTATTILACNYAAAVGLQRCKNYFSPRAITPENNEAPRVQKLPSNLADSVAATTFYVQGRAYRSGARLPNTGFAALFSAAGAVLGEGLYSLFARCRARPQDRMHLPADDFQVPPAPPSSPVVKP